MKRLYFNFPASIVKLVPEAECPPMDQETVFPNAALADDVTLDMVSFALKDGQMVPVITYPPKPADVPLPDHSFAAMSSAVGLK